MVFSFVGKKENTKLIRGTVALARNGCITYIHIRGDFFIYPEEALEYIEKSLEGSSLSEVAQRFSMALAACGAEALGIYGEALQIIVQEAYQSKITSEE
ncbi:MAG: hypothetical protein N2Z76_07370 [Treponemataceae bacterium]|nr:hypothetical protein [Treponemataceae bacterium]